jgi:hypothetical protein
MNKIITGVIVADPIGQYTRTGKFVCNFYINIDEGGNILVTAWEEVGEKIMGHKILKEDEYKKGTPVKIKGYEKIEEWRSTGELKQRKVFICKAIKINR